MISLTYQPAFDPYHAAFRLFRLQSIYSPKLELPVDHVRILDYFLLFPFRASTIRMAPKHSGIKRRAISAAGKQYGNQPEDRGVFARMQAMQIAALETLAMRAFVDAASLAANRVSFTSGKVPAPVQLRAMAENNQASAAVELVRVLATEYELLGLDGLKSRTGLMEYRYDAI